MVTVVWSLALTKFVVTVVAPSGQPSVVNSRPGVVGNYVTNSVQDSVVNRPVLLDPTKVNATT